MKGKLLFSILGAACAVYGVTVLSIVGTRAWFNWFYLCLGIALLAVLAVWPSGSKRGVRKKRVFAAAAAVCAAVFLISVAGLYVFGHIGPESSADYVILLGTQYRTDGPSVEYRARLEAAYGYLTENPGSILIASGGKGSNEPVSEAEGAKRYLTAKGIPEDRILTEDKSTNTAENLVFTADVLRQMGEDTGSIRVVIVSSEYHLLRAACLAKRLGFTDVSCLGCRGLEILLPQWYTREFFALVKDLVTFWL